MRPPRRHQPLRQAEASLKKELYCLMERWIYVQPLRSQWHHLYLVIMDNGRLVEVEHDEPESSEWGSPAIEGATLIPLSRAWRLLARARTHAAKELREAQEKVNALKKAETTLASLRKQQG